MTNKTKADGQMAFRVSSALKDDFTKQAEMEGKKPSQLIIELMMNYLKSTTENQVNLSEVKQLLDRHEQEISQLKQRQDELMGKS
ncbi:MAG: hypothetical protein KME30_28910 [Iphinoe sp. HA4291-MV1]|jgi:type III secretory pathway component EscV|nr:hypothetical protein [Brasilonema angustatum HA4187-MV1]MBW4635754.1 hypothetical protein [Iphinoe sp. HA4291-MV1]